MRKSKSENNPNSSRLDNRAESLMIVNTGTLIESLCNQPGFIAINTTIRSPLNSKDPLAPNDILNGLAGNKFPGSIAGESIKFFTHGSFPFGIGEGLRD